MCSETVTLKLAQCNHTIDVNCGEAAAVKVGLQSNVNLASVK